MIKIGVLGLGNIAQKAYIPVMARMQDRVEWVLCTRNPNVLEQTKQTYNFKSSVSSVEELIKTGIDAVFIHTPTHTHETYIRQFLEHKIHVYVDKPVSESLGAVLELHKLAEEKNRILFTGFNRRCAPLITQLKLVPHKSQIIIQKNRENTLQDTQYALFDMMIHVVDTLVYLMDDVVTDTRYRLVRHADGTLNHALIYLETENCSAQASINMVSGGRKESIEVLSPSGHYIMEDLNQMTIYADGQTRIESFSDWTDTLEKRGFVQMIEHFVQCVETNTPSLIFTPESSIATHALIDELNKSQKN